MRVTGDQNEQLHLLSTKLLLFEAKLLHKQRDIGGMISQRENMLYKQRQIIKILQNRLIEAGIELNELNLPTTRTTDNNKSPPINNDADSAIMMDDEDSSYSCHYHHHHHNHHGVGSGNSSSSTGYLVKRNATSCYQNNNQQQQLQSQYRGSAANSSSNDNNNGNYYQQDDDNDEDDINNDVVTVMRSISDVLELPNSSKILSARRSNGFLRRPEILETVYSVEEDGDTDSCLNGSSSNNDYHQTTVGSSRLINNGGGQLITECNPDKNKNYKNYKNYNYYSSSKPNINYNRNTGGGPPSSPSAIRRLERLSNVVYQSTDDTFSEAEEGFIVEEEQIVAAAIPKASSSTAAPVTAYNRVMSSNHRSVTKPKDVKYRRINKAKSKSLEELRGRLKNWVEKGNKFTFSFDHAN